jgi:ABC-type glycerol-3-phosphate transport system substrate-binding protein
VELLVGNAGMEQICPLCALRLITTGDTRTSAKLDVVAPPAGPAAQVVAGGVNCLFINKYSPHPDEAFALVKFLTSRQFFLESVRQGQLIIPVRKDVLTSRDFMWQYKSIDMEQFMRTQVYHAGGWPLRAKNADKIQPALMGVFNRLAAGQISPQQSVQELQAQLSVLFTSL